jgi:hypothetical protein
MTRFVVDLGAGHNIPAEKQRAIAAAIQAAVPSHLADTPAIANLEVLMPRRWPGLIFRPTVGELVPAEQQIEQFANAP